VLCDKAKRTGAGAMGHQPNFTISLPHSLPQPNDIYGHLDVKLQEHPRTCHVLRLLGRLCTHWDDERAWLDSPDLL
jgi:hypothetical protein